MLFAYYVIRFSVFSNAIPQYRVNLRHEQSVIFKLGLEHIFKYFLSESGLYNISMYPTLI